MDEEEELTWREIIDDEGMEVGSNSPHQKSLQSPLKTWPPPPVRPALISSQRHLMDKSTILSRIHDASTGIMCADPFQLFQFGNAHYD
ncbi:Uncharacterized protein HZ326_19989 [Fusarium oxysporum f. sp. albedinis]|nr:Uncharacterized protein HZ326_19989 [Fusarium oxysporum f. sp. albedinis]